MRIWLRSIYTRRGKTARRSFGDIGYVLDISRSPDTYRVILVIPRLIRAENTRWKSTMVVRPRSRVIYMHGWWDDITRNPKYIVEIFDIAYLKKWSTDNTHFAYEYLFKCIRKNIFLHFQIAFIQKCKLKGMKTFFLEKTVNIF